MISTMNGRGFKSKCQQGWFHTLAAQLAGRIVSERGAGELTIVVKPDELVNVYHAARRRALRHPPPCAIPATGEGMGRSARGGPHLSIS
jgi:hypothetical protein